MFRKIKNIFILFFCCIVPLLGIEREIPHRIVTENPKKEVTEIKSLKKYKEKAELNITVTKVKTENLVVEVDQKRRKIFAKFENVEGEEIQTIERLEDIINSKTAKGRRILNQKAFHKLKRVKRNVVEDNLKTKRYDINVGKKRTKLEIKYREIPKNLYFAVMDGKSDKIKKLYKADYRNYKGTYNHNVRVKLWLFGDELANLTNLVLNYDNNAKGDIEVRSEGGNSYPANATVQTGLHTVFDMQEALLTEDFEDEDKIEIERSTGDISGIANNKGSFYTDRNKYGELVIPGFNVKARIWDQSPKLELSLKKNGNKRDGYVKFYIKHSDSAGNVRQNIEVEVYINNNPINTYYDFSKARFKKRYNGKPIEGLQELGNPEIIFKNLYTDELKPVVRKNLTIERRINDEIVKFSDGEIEIEYKDFTTDSENKIRNGKVTNIYFRLEKDWFVNNYDKKKGVYQRFISRDGLYFEYGNRKRRIPCEIETGYFTSNWDISTTVFEGTIVGLPKVKSPLNKDQFNGDKVVSFKEGSKEFSVFQNIQDIKKKYFYLIVDEKELIKEKLEEGELHNFEFVAQGIKIGLEKTQKYPYHDYRQYDLYIAQMKLEKEKRTIEIEEVNKLYSKDLKKYRYSITLNKITVDPFSVINLVDYKLSSLKDRVEREIDISDKDAKERVINLGNIYFKSFKDLTILTQNASKAPYIELSESVTLRDESGNSIVAKLSFNKTTDERKKTLDNFRKGAGGGNGGSVYLKISSEEYQKLVKNGENKKYTAKNPGIKVKINIDKVPEGLKGTPIGEQEDELNLEIVIRTFKADVNRVNIRFREDKPLLKDKYFGILYGVFDSRYGELWQNFRDAVEISGDPKPYNELKRHKVEVIDGNGNVLNYIMRENGGYGGYWNNLSLDNGNKVIIVQGQGTETYIALSKWNYKRSSGNIRVKHYNGLSDSSGISQYYKFNFELPDFNPYVYYNSIGSKKVQPFESKIADVLESSVNKVELGDIQTQDYDVEITKDEKDDQGLRIEGNISVDILDKATMRPIGEKAKIIVYDMDAYDNKIVGKNKSAKVRLELPENLSKDKDYVIKSSYTSKGDISEKEGYILRIGRNSYFKELIERIEIRFRTTVEGSATINVAKEYNLNDAFTFKVSTNPSEEKLTFEQMINGITLSEVNGAGFIELKTDDNVEVSIGKTNIKVENNVAKEVDISNNKMKLERKDNKLYISFPKIILGVEKQGHFILKVSDRTGEKKGEYTFKVVFPENYLRIVSVKDMDFGRAVLGISGYKATGRVYIETLSDVSKNHLIVQKNKEQVELMKERTSTTDKLVVKMANETLEKKGVKLDGKYKYELTGELDVPKNITLGEYKGTLEITVSIKG